MPGPAADGVGEPGSGGEPPPPSKNPGALPRALAELRRDPDRDNAAIAAAAQCGEGTVRTARVRLRKDLGIARPPRLPRVPPPGWLADGECGRTDLPPQYLGIWTSDSEQDRATARKFCRQCEIQVLCQDWATWNVGLNDPAIYGGDGPYRRRLRRQAAGSGLPCSARAAPRIRFRQVGRQASPGVH
jgi:hypothetical protein